MTDLPIFFAFPGSLDSPSGGYFYDRRLIAGLRDLGMAVELVPLPQLLDDSLQPTRSSLESVRCSLAALPDDATVVIDGLAYGVLDDLAAAESGRLRLVALCHHPLALETGHTESVRTALQRSEQRALHHARAVIVTSGHTGEILIDRFSVPADKLVVARPGTDPTPFAACNGDPLRLLTVASLIPRKGHDLLIEALAGLGDLQWQARFVGSDAFDRPWAAQLRKQVVDSGLSQRISFAGAVTDTAPEYQQADLFVLPSHYEGYGIVFAEALAAGLPIIAARAGAVPEVIPASAGCFIPPGDGAALHDVLQRLLTSASLRRELQAGAQEAAGKLPTWLDCANLVAGKLLEVGVR